jgi:hypothetical protein
MKRLPNEEKGLLILKRRFVGTSKKLAELNPGNLRFLAQYFVFEASLNTRIKLFMKEIVLRLFSSILLIFNLFNKAKNIFLSSRFPIQLTKTAGIKLHYFI